MAGPAHPPDLQLLLRLLLDQLQDYGLILLDAQGCVVRWFNGAAAMFGYTEQEALGRHIEFLFTQEDRSRGIPQHEAAVARSESQSDDDRWHVRKDGGRIWAFGMLIALRDAAGEVVGYAKIVRNRSDVRQQIEELRHRVDELTKSHRRKDVFLSTLAHELRSPLAPLVNAVELMNLTESKPQSLDYPIRLIERQVTTLRRLVDDLLDLTRLGEGKIDLRLERVDLTVVVSHAVDTVRPCIQERRHHLEVLHPASPILVNADPSRLHQVFVNLLENACKYTEPGGRIWVQSTVEADEAVVHVVDTGIGIPTEMRNRIFDLFTQIEGPRYSRSGGLGIGLSLVRDFVALHGGSVQVLDRGATQGSQFSVRLPLAGPATLVQAAQSA